MGEGMSEPSDPPGGILWMEDSLGGRLPEDPRRLAQSLAGLHWILRQDRFASALDRGPDCRSHRRISRSALLGFSISLLCRLRIGQGATPQTGGKRALLVQRETHGRQDRCAPECARTRWLGSERLPTHAAEQSFPSVDNSRTLPRNLPRSRQKPDRRTDQHDGLTIRCSPCECPSPQASPQILHSGCGERSKIVIWAKPIDPPLSSRPLALPAWPIPSAGPFDRGSLCPERFLLL